MKILIHTLIAGAGFWILSDIMELVLKENAPATLWLTALFHLLIAVGIWGAYLGQSTSGSRLSAVATLLISLGYFTFVYPQIAILQNPVMTFAEFLNTNPVFLLIGFISMLGMMLFGLSILIENTYEKWTGIFFLVCPVVSGVLIVFEGLELFTIIPNVAISVAFIAIGVQALRSNEYVA